MELPDTILFERRDHTAIITINREDAMNSLTGEMLGAIDRAFEEVTANDDIWVAILTGAGQKALSSGMDP